MELYGQQSRSRPQKVIIVAAELALIALSYGVLFGDTLSAVRWADSPLYARSVVLFAFNVLTLLRMFVTLFVLLKRKIPWEEVYSVPTAFALYYLGFPLLAAGSGASFGPLEILGILLFVGGAALNTMSELQRKAFKDRAENKGKLFTGGLFGLSMHVNYFGDLLWVTGYALVSHNAVSLLIPALLFAFFAFYNIPKLDSYLRDKYGSAFADYERRTKRFVPFVW